MAAGTHTFLFTDLVGFTALAASEGDDRAADVALEFVSFGDHRLHWLKNLDEPVGARVVAVPEPSPRRQLKQQALAFLCPSPQMKEAL